MEAGNTAAERKRAVQTFTVVQLLHFSLRPVSFTSPGGKLLFLASLERRDSAIAISPGQVVVGWVGGGSRSRSQSPATSLLPLSLPFPSSTSSFWMPTKFRVICSRRRTTSRLIVKFILPSMKVDLTGSSGGSGGNLIGRWFDFRRWNWSRCIQEGRDT